MKKLIVMCVLVAACMGFAREAKAQFAGPIQRVNANLVDRNGTILTDQDIIDLAGEEIFQETVVGARRQLRAGKGLLIGGAAGIGTGLVLSVFTGVAASKVESSISLQDALRQNSSVAGLYLCSVAVTSLGVLALGGGIAFRSIGKSRLSWVADQCSGSSRVAATLHWGATPSGAGIVMRF